MASCSNTWSLARVKSLMESLYYLRKNLRSLNCQQFNCPSFYQLNLYRSKKFDPDNDCHMRLEISSTYIHRRFFLELPVQILQKYLVTSRD